MSIMDADKDFFRDFVDRSSEPVVIHADLEPVYANKAFLRLLGYGSFDELATVGLENAIAPADRARIHDAHWAWKKGESVARVQQVDLLHRDGSVVSTECRIVASQYQGRECLAVNVTDVGYRQELVRQVSELRSRYLEAEAFAQIGYFRWHRSRNLVELSPQAQVLFGLTNNVSTVDPDTFVGLFADTNRAQIWSMLSAISASGAVLDLEAVQTADQWRFLNVTVRSEAGRTDGEPDLFGLLRDVTAEHRKREALHLLARRQPEATNPFEVAARALAVGLGYRAAAVYRLSEDGRRTCQLARSVDEGFDRWFGEGLEPGKWYPVRGTVCEAIIDSRDIVCVADGVPERFPGAPMSRELDARACVGAPIFDTRGAIIGHVLAMHDKPDRRGADLDLVGFVAEWSALEMEQQKAAGQRETQQKMWQSIADTMPAILLLKDRDGRLTYANGAYYRIFGVPEDELLGHTVRERAERGHLNFSEDDLTAIETLDAQAWQSNDALPMIRVAATSSAGDTIHWLLAKRQIVDGRDGQPKILTIGLDITDRVTVEEALLESETRLRGILQNLPGAVMRQRVIADGRRETEFVSDRIRDLFDLERVPQPHEIRQLFSDAMELSDFETFHNDSLKAYTAGEPYTLTARIVTAKGAEKWLSHRSHVVAELDDGWVVETILMDDTERYRAVQALRESEQQLRGILRNLPGTVSRARVDRNGKREYLFNSGGLEELFGIKPDHILSEDDRLVTGQIGPLLSKLIDPAELRRFERESAEAFAKGQPYFAILEHSTLDGEQRWSEVRSHVVAATQDGWIVDSLSINVTSRVQAEKALRDNEQQLQAIVQNLPGAISRARVSRDGHRNYLFLSGGIEQIHNISIEEVYDEDGRYIPGRLEALLEKTTAPEELKRLYSESVEAYARGEPYSTVLQHRATDGNRRWAAHRSHAVAAENDCWIVDSLTIDVTDRVEAQIQLREREAQFSALLSNIPGAAWRSRVFPDERREFVFLSDGWEELTGWTVEETMEKPGQVIQSLFQDIDLDSMLADTRRTYEAGLPFVRTYQVQCKSGEIKWLTHRSSVVAVEGDILIADGLAIDDTDQVVARQQLAERDRRLQMLQAELLQASRISAMGALSSAIAHEISQPLAAVSNYLTASEHVLSKDEIVLPEKVSEYLAKARTQSERAGAVIGSLRRFFERGEHTASPEDINDVVEEALALALLDNQVGRTKVNRVYGKALPMVEIDRVQIQQVVLNLVRNAIQAMRDNGLSELSIRTKRAECGVIVEVEDTGPGLSEEVADRIFDRFVTSRSDGMGMGLAICKSVLDAHDSTLEFRLCEEGGTVFYFALPVAKEEVARDRIA